MYIRTHLELSGLMLEEGEGEAVGRMEEGSWDPQQRGREGQKY